jgi:hypothetical protein
MGIVEINLPYGLRGCQNCLPPCFSLSEKTILSTLFGDPIFPYLLNFSAGDGIKEKVNRLISGANEF